MDQFIARANIDHYLALLYRGDTAPDRRPTLTRLLLEEEDKLGLAVEHLEFVEGKLISCRDIVKRQELLMNRLALGSQLRDEAERTLANFEAVLKHVENSCLQMRAKFAKRL